MQWNNFLDFLKSRGFFWKNMKVFLNIFFDIDHYVLPHESERRGATSMLEVIVIFFFWCQAQCIVCTLLVNAIWEILHYFLETPLSCTFFLFSRKKQSFLLAGFRNTARDANANSFLSSTKALKRKNIDNLAPNWTKCHVFDMYVSQWIWKRSYCN